MLNLEITKRNNTGVTILDLVGKIHLGLTSSFYRNTLANLSKHGENQVLLNFAQVNYIDGSGFGEMVKSYNIISSFGGKIKIVNPTKNIFQLINLTKLETVFEVFDNEPDAIESFENNLNIEDKKVLPFIREPHHEKSDDDLGLPENPIYSNYSKYQWKRKPTFRRHKI